MTFVGSGEQKKQTIRYAIDYCADNFERLTEWENGFIESISEKFERYGSLSEKQEEILEKIYCKLP